MLLSQARLKEAASSYAMQARPRTTHAGPRSTPLSLHHLASHPALQQQACTQSYAHARTQQKQCVRAQAATTTSEPEAPPQNTPQAKDYFATDRRPIILYDGVCNLCNGAVNIMLDLDPEGTRFRMAALQSPAGKSLLQRCGRHPDDISSIVLVEPGYRHFIRSDAILKIASGLSNPFPLLAFFGFPVPPFIRDAIYDQVANNRYSFFGQTDSCRLSNDGQEHRFVVD